MKSIKPMLSHKITMITFQEAMNRMGKNIRNMMAIDTSGSMKIFMEDLDIEANSMEIETIDRGDKFRVSRAIRKATDTQTVHIKIGLT